MKRLEAEFTTRFRKWLLHRWPNGTGHFEVKVARTDALSFSEVSLKQETNLRIAKKKFVHKFSDFDRMGTPFDLVYTEGGGSYIVINYYNVDKDVFYIIEIGEWLEEKIQSKRRSLTFNRAREIGITYKL